MNVQKYFFNMVLIINNINLIISNKVVAQYNYMNINAILLNIFYCIRKDPK